MTIFFSKSKRGFYDSKIHLAEQMPDDCVKVLPSEYKRLLLKQADGGEIEGNETGSPIWVDKLNRSLSAEDIRARREMLLIRSDWTQVADAPVDQAAWATYRQALRDIPQQEDFPESVIWPEMPGMVDIGLPIP